MSNQEFLKPKRGFATATIHAGVDPDQWAGAVVPPIITSTTFKHENSKGYVYGRSGNPSRQALEDCLARLDGAKHAMAFASGLGATTTLVSLLDKGDHIIASDDLYGGTSRLFRHVVMRLGIEISFVDCTRTENIVKAMQKNTKMVFIESPTNPMLNVLDIAEICKLVKGIGNILVAVDNTFLTPYLQRPLDFGADIVLYSLTKYMNGHSDVVMGATVVNDDDLAERLRFLQKGLPNHPHYEITKKQTAGHSGVFSFKHDGGLKESEAILNSLKVFTLAESLGGYESLAELPVTMTHASVPEEHRLHIGLTDQLIRLSVGLEDTEDLIEDLEQALKVAFP